MPLPLAPPVIAGLASVAGNTINAVSQGLTNASSRRFSERMYQRQYDDNLKLWNLQNTYNDPRQQMQRLRAAGLNPNMVYGGSSGGTAGTAPSLGAPSPLSASFRAPEYGNAVSQGPLAFLNAMYDLDIKKAQAENLQAQNDVIKQDAALRLAQVGETDIRRKRGEFDLGLSSELRSVSADSARENLRKLKTSTDIELSRNEREALANSSNLREAAERILTMRVGRTQAQAQIANTNMDTELKRLEVELRHLGITPNTPWWGQIIGRILSDYLSGGEGGILQLLNPFQKR